jgi:hypothetical protein
MNGLETVTKGVCEVPTVTTTPCAVLTQPFAVEATTVYVPAWFTVMEVPVAPFDH